jgi:hypothetical protein
MVSHREVVDGQFVYSVRKPGIPKPNRFGGCLHGQTQKGLE